MAGLKEALASVEHQMHAKPGPHTSRRPLKLIAWPDPHQPPTDAQIAFANKIVAAMKNRLTEDRIMVGMPPGKFS